MWDERGRGSDFVDDLNETHKLLFCPTFPLSLIKWSSFQLRSKVTERMLEIKRSGIKMFHWFLFALRFQTFNPGNRHFMRHRHEGAAPLFYELFMTFTTFFPSVVPHLSTYHTPCSFSFSLFPVFFYDYFSTCRILGYFQCHEMSWWFHFLRCNNYLLHTHTLKF